MAFAELDITSNFTFLTGASHPEEYVDRAALLGIGAVAIADENSVAGIVRAHARIREIARQVEERARIGLIGPPAPVEAWAKCPLLAESYPGSAARRRAGTLAPEETQDFLDGPKAAFETRPAPPPPLDASAAILNVPRLIPAARIVLVDGFTVTALPRDRAGWGRLCRLISRGRLRAEKGSCQLRFDDLLEFGAGQALLLHPPEAQAGVGGASLWRSQAERLSRRFPGDVRLLMAPRYDGEDPARFDRLAALADSLGLETVASASPRMHHGARRKLADVLTAIRSGLRVEELGRAALANAEERLRSEAEMRRIFGPHEGAVDRAAALAARLTFSLDELRYEYPSEAVGGETASERLHRLAHEGLAWRYPSGAPDHVRKLLDHELGLISKLRYEPYFLTVNDIVAFARSRGILCQGRGSAANSVVCYCLGVTSVSPEIGTMVFERFVSEARDEPPDIDVDFEHERREEVIQHIYERYGRHRAGLCATVIHYRGKRAIREVGRAMGLSEDTIGAISSQLWGFFDTSGMADQQLREIGLDPTDRRLAQTLELIFEIQGFPRHLSQHVGGFVITEGRLDELVPVENATMEDRTVICWDKDDIDALGILKVDVLALGMLSCIRKAFDLIGRHHQVDYTLATLPPEDPATYDMLCKADSLGVFQVESRAQMNFLPRMKPRCFYDLVIETAIIRPGPIQGDMVHPYLRRRNGEEKVEFPSDALGQVLGKTLGVPLFQEQAMQIAIVGAGFAPEEADRLRRALATFKKLGNVSEFRTRFMKGMRENGYDDDFAERCFSQIEGFGSYGFPESHAASFALLVYASAWLKRHHPGIFACALLNSQPMGFYAPAQIVRDAREHGVSVRPPDINASTWDNVMEPDGQGGLALRLGFRQIKSMREEEAAWIAAARGNGYRSVEDVWRRAGVEPRLLRVLAEADVFASLGLARREALWAAAAIGGEKPLPLFAGDMDGEGITEAAAHLPAMSAGEEVVEDYVSMRLTLRHHPIAFLRHKLTPGRAPLVEAGPGAAPDPGGFSRATGLIRTDIWGREGDTDSRRESRRR
ncbi:DNA polymerase III subunit alpha [Alphaproteobacteria bacterium GH1-50]|uniref:Error-prone DNA polymerase n=1 Tax=Kangsaoukella pontilimi TaxID=2691042 RepID=A0A7C9IHX1_9RHOB|nr:error-prone DNA polymerase [Kangsaoukella pontilimi]MXQ09388.1 DNA polymerase III subunit alpha [Kangsaoukella pontilimi]